MKFPLTVHEHILEGGKSVYINYRKQAVSFHGCIYSFLQVRELARVSNRAGGRAFKQMLAIIDDFGWDKPIVVNTN